MPPWAVPSLVKIRSDISSFSRAHRADSALFKLSTAASVDWQRSIWWLNKVNLEILSAAHSLNSPSHPKCLLSLPKPLTPPPPSHAWLSFHPSSAPHPFPPTFPVFPLMSPAASACLFTYPPQPLPPLTLFPFSFFTSPIFPPCHFFTEGKRLPHCLSFLPLS